MATAAVQLIEVALVGALRAALGSSVQVDSYAGQLDDERWEWIRSLPAVWVTFDRTTAVKRVSARAWRMAGRYYVMAAQRAYQEPDRRLGTASGIGADRGVYQLLEDAKAALVGQTLSLPIEPLQPGAIVPVLQGRPSGGDAVAIFSQAIETWWVEVFPQPDATPEGELQTIDLQYHLQPDDGTADAADRVTLPEA